MGRHKFQGTHMQFMVIETLRHQDARSGYRRYKEKGPPAARRTQVRGKLGCRRSEPHVAADGVRGRRLLQRWVAEWSNLVQFEIVPVVACKETAAALAPQL